MRVSRLFLPGDRLTDWLEALSEVVRDGGHVALGVQGEAVSRLHRSTEEHSGAKATGMWQAARRDGMPSNHHSPGSVLTRDALGAALPMSLKDVDRISAGVGFWEDLVLLQRR